MLVIENRHGGREKHNHKGGLLSVCNHFTVLNGDLVTLDNGATYKTDTYTYRDVTGQSFEKNGKTYNYRSFVKFTELYREQEIVYIASYWEGNIIKYRKLPKKDIKNIEKSMF